MTTENLNAREISVPPPRLSSLPFRIANHVARVATVRRPALGAVWPARAPEAPQMDGLPNLVAGDGTSYFGPTSTYTLGSGPDQRLG